MAKENQNKKPLRYLVAYRLQGAKESEYKTALIVAYTKQEAGEIMKRYADAMHLVFNNVVFKRVRSKTPYDDNYYVDFIKRQYKSLERLEAEARKEAQA